MADAKKAKLAVAIMLLVPTTLVLVGEIAGLIFVYLGWHKIPFQVTPLTIIKYLYLYADDHALRRRFAISIGVPVVLATVGMIALFAYKPRPTLYGEGRWANKRELKKAHMLDGDGVILGQLGNDIVVAHPEHHIQLKAPTGAGKGVAIVLPNLLSWNGSAVVNDIKGENFEMTSRFRQAYGHEIYVFNPSSNERRTHRWNPLGYLSADPMLQGKEIQQIAAMLWPPSEDKGEPWKPGSRNLFAAAVRWLVETKEEPTLPKVARFVATLQEAAIKNEILARKEAGAPFSGELVTGFAQYFSMPEKMRESVRGDFNTGLEVVTNDPLLSLALSGNDFDLRMLRKRPMTIYVITPGPDLSRLQRIINIFFQQAASFNSETEFGQEPDHRCQLMLLMDEFTSMGDVAAVVDKISYFRSYGIKLVTIYQSESQIEGVYGEHRTATFRENHKTRLAFTPVDREEADRISKSLPATTSYSKSKSGRKTERKTYSENEAARQLMLPDEVMYMPEDEVIVFTPYIPPTKMKKVSYFNNPVFIDRLKSVSPTLRACKWRKSQHADYKKARLAGELKVEIPALPLPAAAAPVSVDWAKPEKPTFKVATAEDLENIDAMDLADIQINGMSMAVPEEICRGTPEEKREHMAKMMGQLLGGDDDEDDYEGD